MRLEQAWSVGQCHISWQNVWSSEPSSHALENGKICGYQLKDTQKSHRGEEGEIL